MRKRSKNIEKVRASRLFKRVIWRGITLAAASFLALGVGGCSQVAYYGQSIIGHSQLMLARQPIEKAIAVAQNNQQADLAQQLELAQQLRLFAVQELGLPDNNSYRTFVALDREFPVWNVVAAEEFSIVAKQWCYLVIGCASYRGYFKREAAEAYAERIGSEGFETVVGGVGAYSTLGWFSDPLLPSMFRYGEAVFAETLFHELAHQVIYVNGESDLNEAFATVVGEQGAQQWLARYRPALLPEYQNRLAAQRDFNNLLAQAREQLATAYESGNPASIMRKEKQEIFSKLRIDYQALKVGRWGGIGWYDQWMSQSLNNARLAALATYFEQVPYFESILTACGFDFSRFYRRVEKLIDQQKREFENVDCTMS